MITVEIEYSEVARLDCSSVTLYISNKLRNAGIPVTGFPKVTTEHGILESIYLVKEDKMLYRWRDGE